MRKTLLFLLVMCGQLICQNEGNQVQSNNDKIITGVVTDATNSQPLEFVSVYLSGTTIGTITNKDGNFTLPQNNSQDNNLVISLIGYKSEIITISQRRDNNNCLQIKLKPQVINFSPIDIEAKEAGEWKGQFDRFFKLFIGTDDFALDCSIENKYKIDFKENDDSFVASCKEPLKITNRALGYKINCLLNTFEVDKNKSTVSYIIFPFFSDMIPSTPDSLNLLKRNRSLAYLGSSRHLLQTLINPRMKLNDERFELFFYKNGKASRFPIDSPNELVYKDSVTGNFRFNPESAAEKRNLNCNCILVKYSGPVRNGTSTILATKKEGIEFDKRGFFLYQQEYFIGGKMGLDRISSELPNNWNWETEKLSAK